MKYEEFVARSAFSRDELLTFAGGSLVEDAPPLFAARLPLPPMLMVDRITDISTRGSRGRVVAERAVSREDWFFACHFAGDPVQPGCLGVDAVWQLLGFYCAWRGGLGAGRALGCGAVSFDGQIRPEDSMVRYEVEVRRCTGLSGGGATLSIADAVVLVDERPVYTLKDARVGLFPDLARENAERKSGTDPDFAASREIGIRPRTAGRTRGDGSAEASASPMRADVPIVRARAEVTL